MPDHLTDAVRENDTAFAHQVPPTDTKLSYAALAGIAIALRVGQHLLCASRTVGVPLLVHRRCDQPMFGISNAVAYEHLMVQGRGARQSAIRDILGPSRWIDIAGDASEKWCPAEGNTVLALLRYLM